MWGARVQAKAQTKKSPDVPGLEECCAVLRRTR
jgi:hypothetical protein